jgi:hypothetical protein
MGRLVSRFTGDGRTAGAMKDSFIGHEAGGKRTPSGVIVGGATFQLEGQPPVATTHGWGNLSFLFRRR